MKNIESDPDVHSTAFSREQGHLNDIFLEILPVIFHKLKNKLTPVIGYTQILKSRSRDDFTLERLGKIERNANELTDLLNLLKDYGKAESAPRRPGNINRIVKKLKPGLEKSATACQIAFRFVLDPGVPDMLLHPGQVELLLLNLAANAMTALKLKTAAQKEIVLATRVEEGGVKLIMRDNGIGMEQEELDNIWVPFYAKFQNGAGLGLVICEKIIANHDAVCQVRSGFGEFSEFEITFPRAEEPLKIKNKSVSKRHSDNK
jgi:signal transduction histidine kinase